ncbi:MAG TPA: hypothetical protein VFL57_08645 [Bryobacteraceae bacterium]|nr:hypothetical protein [Bryobacteraceae bacterium]
MRLVLAFWALFVLVGCVCMVANAQDRSSHSHREHTILTLSMEQQPGSVEESAAVVQPKTEVQAAPGSQGTPGPLARPGISVIFCTRGPDVLRSLARLLTIAVQFWRA